MKTIQLELFSFEELSEDAQKNAISENQYINIDFDWWNVTYEDAKNIGLKITSFDLDRNKHAKGHFIDDAHFCATEIVKNHGKDYDSYKLAEQFVSEWNEAVKLHSDGIKTDIVMDGQEIYFDNYVDGLENKFLEDVLCYYADYLQKESEYLQSDEAIKNTLIANEYDFTVEGNIY